MTTKTKSLASMIEEYKPCEEAQKWLREEGIRSASQAWLKCRKPEWMLWALNSLELVDDRKHRLFACWCARNTPLKDGRTTWDLLTDQRSRTAVEVAERFADGKATQEELAAARAAAWDAARAAAWDAARAAARDAAGAAAWDAAGAAARDAARAAAWAAAGAAAWDAQANAIRTIYGNPFASKKRSRS